MDMMNKYKIASGLGEILGGDELGKILATRPLKLYWGTAPTGKIHIGYLIPLMKIADFLNAGCEVKILFADLHAMLDSMKSTSELIEYRCAYYEAMIKSILKNLRVPLDKLIFIKGSSFQLSEKYTTDVYKLTSLISLHDAKKAGAEVVKQSDNPRISGLLYPILQALDEEYLDVDATLGGIDQRKIYTFAQEILPLLGYKRRIHLMNPMLTAINAKPDLNPDSDSVLIEDLNLKINIIKMSSSDRDSKIEFLDTKNEIKKKVKAAYCAEGDIQFNPLMELVSYIIFPLLQHLGKDNFIINRNEKYGGQIVYQSFDDIKTDFSEKKLHPMDLKQGIADFLDEFIDPIRREFAGKEMMELMGKAYP